MPRLYSPSRREVTLVLFSVMIFVIFYNLESTFDFFTGSKLASTFSNPLATGGGLDTDIYGDWVSEDIHVASIHKQQEEKEDSAEEDTMWIKSDLISEAQKQIIFGNINVNDGFKTWGSDMPQTQLVKHVAGFSIMDNVIACNGTIFIVTDDPSSFPSLGSIASSVSNPYEAPHPGEWAVLSVEQARERLGSYGGLIQGVSWLSYDVTPNNYTLFSLWRTYSSLNTSTSPGHNLLPPPRRLFFPNIPTFKDPRPRDSDTPTIRHRSDSGFHSHLPKAAFPTLGLMYMEDWEDYAQMEVPFLIEKLVVADLGAAGRSTNDVPPFAVPHLGLDASTEWWEPIRQNLAHFFNGEDPAQNANSLNEKPIVTYISRQDAVGGSKLRRSDHNALVAALETLRGSNNFEVYIVSSEGQWTERLSAVAKSTVVLGVYGESLADSVFMRPSGHSTLMEFFPSGVFNRNTEIAAHSLGLRYIGWWNDQQFLSNNLPPVTSGSDDAEELLIDATAVVQAIQQLVTRT
ncbi:hypothetical protein M405DRAFT_738703 [Rhizopogon salebrosus TDB-379]|nr:hypothetical protein M405DRAFT_738703 [Rhizopogon salebrosus TDB-379]